MSPLGVREMEVGGGWGVCSGFKHRVCESSMSRLIPNRCGRDAKCLSGDSTVSAKTQGEEQLVPTATRLHGGCRRVRNADAPPVTRSLYSVPFRLPQYMCTSCVHFHAMM